jgi:hypothetical protein
VNKTIVSSISIILLILIVYYWYWKGGTNLRSVSSPVDILIYPEKDKENIPVLDINLSIKKQANDFHNILSVKKEKQQNNVDRIIIDHSSEEYQSRIEAWHERNRRRADNMKERLEWKKRSREAFLKAKRNQDKYLYESIKAEEPLK